MRKADKRLPRRLQREPGEVHQGVGGEEEQEVTEDECRLEKGIRRGRRPCRRDLCPKHKEGKGFPRVSPFSPPPAPPSTAPCWYCGKPSTVGRSDKIQLYRITAESRTFMGSRGFAHLFLNSARWRTWEPAHFAHLDVFSNKCAKPLAGSCAKGEALMCLDVTPVLIIISSFGDYSSAAQ